MPEPREAMSVVIDEPQIPSGVPLREGEERYASTLNLEDARRRDSVRVDVPLQKYSQSISARARQKTLRAKVEELRSLTRRHGDIWEGPCAPATVINFNPVKLTLQGELQDQSVPPAGSTSKKVTFRFKGRSFTGSYVTLANAKVWPVIIGTENLEGYDGAPSIKADYISPVGIAHQFYSHYVEGAIDAMGMGGIVIFEGDIRVLERKRQEKTEGRIRVPMIDPELSEPAHPAYRIQELFLDDCLSGALTRQRQFAEAVIAEGHGFATSNSDEIRKQLTRSWHVLWHDWSIDVGYKTEPEPWASERLSDAPDVQAVFCPDCRTRQKSPDQYFCANCNAPFDALKAYLAGKTVSSDRLAMYDGKEFEQIMAEKKRRDAKIALLEGEPVEKKGKKSEEK